MTKCLWLVLPVLAATLFGKSAFGLTFACSPVSFARMPVVNVDQSVIIIWNASEKKQHFIRKASFKSEADNLGFLVPSPTQPELE